MSKFYAIKKIYVSGSREMSQQFRALAALVEDLGSISSAHIEAHNGL